MTYNLIRTWSVLFCILSSSIGAWAHTSTSSNKDNRDSLKNAKSIVRVNAKTQRNFPQLESYIQNAQSAFTVPFESMDVAPEFTPQYIAENFTVSTEMADARAQAQATLDEIERKGSYTDNISPKDLVELPIGMKKKLGNSNVTIGVSKAKFLPEYTLLTIFCKIDLPQQNKSIFFGADSIKLSHKGGLIGGGNLVLLGDFQIPINGNNMMITLKGGLNMRTGEVANLTYVKMECNGVKELGISADVSFPRNLLVPLTADFKVDSTLNKKVQGSFKTIVTDWNDILAENITFEPFAIKGMERIAFKLEKAVFDMSDFRNGTAINFPKNYAGFVKGSESLWRGVYIKEFDVILPKEFKDKKTPKPVGFSAKDLIIDNTGITGFISGINILETGSASGWDFSIAKFEIELQSNTLRSAGFNGSIAIPVSKKKSETDSVKKYGLAYRAVFLSNNDYLMNVSIKDSIAFDLWKAKAKILAGSYVELVNKDEQFKPKAVLTGELKISVLNDKGESDFSIGSVGFQDLTIQTVQPYLSIGGASMTAQKQGGLANFPLTVDGIRLKITGNKAEIALDTIRLNLMEKGDNKLSATGSISIVGEFNKVEDNFAFDFKSFRVNDIGIKANFKGFSLDGFIKLFREHPIMGTGLSGAIDMGVTIGGQKVAIKAKAAFGKKTYRYWYVDALASGFKIPVGGVFNINGLGGGASYQMDRAVSKQSAAISQECPSGIGFIPDSTKGVGFRAMVSFELGSKTAAQGDLTFEMLFNRGGGGLARIGLFGKATILPPAALLNIYNGSGAHLNRMAGLFKTQATTIEKDTALYNKSIKEGKFGQLAVQSSDSLKAESEGSIRASIGIEYDFNNKVLDGNFEVYMNVAGGLIRGVGEAPYQDRAGYAKIFIAAESPQYPKGRWYVFLGTSEPGKELGVKFDLGIGAIEARTYLMIGDSLGGSPPPPVEVATILGRSVQELDYMRDLNNLNNGGGFAFGAHLSTRFDARFGKIFSFYAEFSAGIGFDIMIKRYLDADGNPAHCKGQNSPLGINGWYANGQAYAYLQGRLGIGVDLLFIKKDVDIITAGAAVLLQAKGPNPTWMTGYMGGHFSVLSGLISGSFSCKVSFGENCEIEGTNPIDEKIEFITRISPDDRTEGVDPLGVVQAYFKYPIGSVFYLANGESGEQVSYDKSKLSQDANNRANNATTSAPLKARLVKFELVSKRGNLIEPRGTPLFSEKNMVVEYPSHSALASDDSITATVEVAFQYYNPSTYAFEDYYLDGKLAIQRKVITFKTTKRPKNIPLSNIEFTYPVIDQKFFYPREHNKGFIKLKRGQKYLFDEESDVKLQFTKADGTSFETPIVYNDTEKEFTYDMPILENSQFYKIKITSKNPNVVATRTLLDYSFNTSRHNTFTEKLTTYKPRSYYSKPNVITLIVNSSSSRFGGKYMGFTISSSIDQIEAFDITEIQGTLRSNRKPLVNPISKMNDPYYVNDIEPFMGQGYRNYLLTRDTSIYGSPPAKAIIPILYYFDTVTVPRFPYEHAVSSVFGRDLEDIKRQIFKDYPPENCKPLSGNGNNSGNPYGNTGGNNPYVDPNMPPCDYRAQSSNCNFCCDTCTRNMSQGVAALYSKPLPELREGKYDVDFRYILPNGLQTSSPVFSYYHTKDNMTTADAGIDQIKTNGTFSLSAQGQGTWSIVNAPIGFDVSNISNLTSSYATLSGVPADNSVTLQWTVKLSNGAELSDIVTLFHVSGAKAGADQTSIRDTFFMSGNANGKWTIIKDETCYDNIKISESLNPQAIITNLPLEKPITLRWTLNDGTGTLYDDVVIRRQVPINMAGDDITQYDSTFIMSAKLNNGAWKVVGGSYINISDTANLQSTVVLNESNKPVTLNWIVTDNVCNQTFSDEIVLTWIKADLGGSKCLSDGSFTTKGYGNGQWSISESSADLSIDVDSFVTKNAGEYFSTFDMPVSRLPENAYIQLKWTLVNGQFDTVRYKRTGLINAGVDQSSYDSVFTLNASLGNGHWEIASAPTDFDISKIVDIYEPKTKVTLPNNSTVKLIWKIEDECRNEGDTVILVRKKLGNLIDGLTSEDRNTHDAFASINATGEGEWSIEHLPVGTDTTTDNRIILGNLNQTYITLWLSKIPIDSTITLKWISSNGDYDFIKITYKKEVVIKAKIYLEQFYNQQLGYMVRPSNTDSLVNAAYPVSIYNQYYIDFLKEFMKSDSTIMYPIVYYSTGGQGGGYYVSLKTDGSVTENSAIAENMLRLYTYGLSYSQQTGTYSGLLTFSINNFTYQNGNISGSDYQEVAADYTQFQWGNIYNFDFTNGSIQRPNLIPKSHPTLGTVYVLKKGF
jgi:hypothetical protein